MKAWVSAFALPSACLGLFVAGCGNPSASRSHTLDLPALALQKSDVPGGFSADPARYWTDQQAATRDHVSLPSYRSHGRIRSYSDSYSVSITSTVQAGGLVRPQSEITQFKNTSGAQWYWSRLSKSAARAVVIGATTLGSNAGSAGQPVRFKPIRIPGVGDERAAFTVRAGGDEVDYQITVIVWRRSNFVDMLRVRAVAEEFPLSKIAGMARRIDERTRKA